MLDSKIWGYMYGIYIKTRSLDLSRVRRHFQKMPGRLMDKQTDKPTKKWLIVVNECHKIIQTHLTCLYIVEKALLTTLLRMDQRTDRPMD